MHLEMRFEPTGAVRPFWYGRFVINGKKECVNLGVRLVGSPPASRKLRDLGDPEFERSRGMAQARLREVAEEAASVRDSARLVERLYRIKTGAKVRTVRLEDLADRWAGLPRRRPVADRYAKEGRRILTRFVEFVRSRNRKAEELVYVDAEVAEGFMASESVRGVSARTWNGTLKLLRSTFKRLLPSGAPNAFDGLVTREGATVFRKPFTASELQEVLKAAKGDPFIRPIIIAGMCTAMRRGDCCLLRWKDVDLDGGFVTVKTAKTGGTVSIPIFGLLRHELVTRRKEAFGTGAVDPGGYVFPDQAAMYHGNPDGITRRVKQVLWAALAGAGQAGAPADPGEGTKSLEEASTGAVLARGREFIGGLAASDKRERMRAVFDAYMGGKDIAEVAAQTGVSKGSVSGYLNEIQAGTGCKVLRWRAGQRGLATAVKGDNKVLSAERSQGVRRASVRDFHSFRVTWVTLALTAGVPLELVQRVTGHKTTDVVLKHYFRPGQEDFRQALEGAMPRLLTAGRGGETTDYGTTDCETAENKTTDYETTEAARNAAREQMRGLLGKVKPKGLREELLRLLERV